MSQSLNILHLVDYPDSKFLIGAYREEKNQLEWIRDKKLYNIRKNVNLFDSRDGGQLTINKPSFIVLYNYKTLDNILIYECIGLQEKTSQEMKALEYPKPQGAYFIFELGKELTVPSLELKAFLVAYKETRPGYKNAAPIIIEGKDLKGYVSEEENWFGVGEIAPKVPAKKKKSNEKNLDSRETAIQRLISNADILEDDIERLGRGEDFDSLLELLLRDQTKGLRVMPVHLVNGEEQTRENLKFHHHIIWATDNYCQRGNGYLTTDEIEVKNITRRQNRVVRPRALKSKAEQQRRIKQKAEVFTPSWVCNNQNNLVDEAWFGRKDVFNHENEDHTWTSNPNPIEFSDKKGQKWLDYVTERRIEICCGEAPYIVSRYDTTTGELIPLKDRIGLLDRKLRVVGEQAKDLEHWREYAYKALRSVYGFEWQGDSLLIARENIFVTFIEYYYDFCAKLGIKSEISTQSLAHVAYIISWNIFQMDGIRYIIPYSDQEPEIIQSTLNFDDVPMDIKIKREGIYAKTTRWIGDGRQKYHHPFEFRTIIPK